MNMEPDKVLEMIAAEESKRAAEKSLYEFVRQAWSVIEPGVPFVDGWHIRIICEHLEAITNGEIRFLLINIPPRHAKSTIVSVMWPCWEWIHKPEQRYLCASYSGVLSIRDSVNSRRLLNSVWYRTNWGDRFSLSDDQNQKSRFSNNKTGYRIASSVGGTATGEGGSRLILDDPHGAQDAQSDSLRGSTIEWFDMVWSTRMNNPRKDAMVTIMQRLHESDVSGRILSSGRWEHLCLPAEFDGVKRSTIILPEGYDPRSNVGDLLWPARFGKDEIDKLKESLGDYGSAGQLQQNPAPDDGGILNTTKFGLWPVARQLPQIEFVVQSYDCAFTEKVDGDPTACSVWGMFNYDGKYQGMLLDAWDERLAYPDLRMKVIDDWNSRYGGSDNGRSAAIQIKSRKPDVVLVEEKASGQSLIQDLQLAKIPVIGYNPGRAGKKARAHMASVTLDLGILWIPESNKNKGQFVSWASEFVKQLKKFPVAEHDDYVDTFSQAIIYLKDSGWFELPEADEDDEDADNYYGKRKKKVNPYAL